MGKDIKQNGKTYRQDWKGDWVADKDWKGDDKVERDWLGNPKIERDWLGHQKIERDWKGDPIVPPEENDDCFIAVAAYGTPFTEEIQILRDWRDDVLKKSSLGKQVVELYYKVSPPTARYIQQSGYLRSATRYLLSPLVNYLKTKYPK